MSELTQKRIKPIVYQSVHFHSTINAKKKMVKKDFELLTTFHNENRKSQRQLLESIYEKNNYKKEKLILTNHQMNELYHKTKTSKNLPVIEKKNFKIKKLQFANKKESILESLEKEKWGPKKRYNSSENMLQIKGNKKYKSIYDTIHQSRNIKRIFECFSKPIYFEFKEVIK